MLLWELTTLAQQPYVEVAACEMAEYLRDGYRLAQPLNCPDDLYKVMAFCWAIHPHDRPQAKLILDYLAAFHHQLNSFIWYMEAGGGGGKGSMVAKKKKQKKEVKLSECKKKDKQSEDKSKKCEK